MTGDRERIRRGCPPLHPDQGPAPGPVLVKLLRWQASMRPRSMRGAIQTATVVSIRVLGACRGDLKPKMR